MIAFFQVLVVDPKKSKLQMTCKKSLIKSSLPAITDYEQCIKGSTVEGFVASIKPNGLVVVFFNGIKVWKLYCHWFVFLLFLNLCFVFDKGSFYQRSASCNKETFSLLKITETGVVRISDLLKIWCKLWKTLVEFDFSFIIVFLIDLGSMVLWIYYAMIACVVLLQFIGLDT